MTLRFMRTTRSKINWERVYEVKGGQSLLADIQASAAFFLRFLQFVNSTTIKAIATIIMMSAIISTVTTVVTCSSH